MVVCTGGGDCVYGDGGGCHGGRGSGGDVFDGISDCHGGCSHHI